MIKMLAVMAVMAFGAGTAFAQGAPKKLSDAQLDRVTAGMGTTMPVAFLGPPILRPPTLDPWKTLPPAPPRGIPLPLPLPIIMQPMSATTGQ